MIRKIEDVCQPIVGETYLVPCFIFKTHTQEWEWKYRDYEGVQSEEFEYVPIFNHLHNDKENGQEEAHYHLDSRWDVSRVKTYVFNNMYIRVVPDRFVNHRIEYLILKMNKLIENTRTPLSYIKKSKLKHDCMHRLKCPHRGFDLTNVVPVDGVITCPLHSLKFDMHTYKLIT